MHQLLISVMKCKQGTTKENVNMSNELLNDFLEFYFDEHELEHIKEFEGVK